MLKITPGCKAADRVLKDCILDPSARLSSRPGPKDLSCKATLSSDRLEMVPDILSNILSFLKLCNKCKRYQLIIDCTSCNNLICENCNYLICDICYSSYCNKCVENKTVKDPSDIDNVLLYCKDCSPLIYCNLCENNLVHKDYSEYCTDCGNFVCKECEWSIEPCNECGDQFCDECNCECN